MHSVRDNALPDLYFCNNMPRYEDVTGCSSAADCNYPMGYCKCFPEGARCVPFRSTTCQQSVDDLVQCMTARNCNFDNDIEAWAFATPTSCVAQHCSAQ